MLRRIAGRASERGSNRAGARDAPGRGEPRAHATGSGTSCLSTSHAPPLSSGIRASSHQRFKGSLDERANEALTG
eukprot:13158315-Alexandrium_andersonii.AAC.1